MSVILDALKKAQKERPGKQLKPEYSGSDKKRRLKIFNLIVTGIVACAVIAVILTFTMKRGFKISYSPGTAKTSHVSTPAPEAGSKGVAVLVPEKTEITLPIVPKKRNEETQKMQGSKKGKAKPEAPLLPVSINPSVKRETLTHEAPEAEEELKKPAAGARTTIALYDEGLDAMKSGDINLAKELFRKVVSEAPWNVEALNNLGVIALQEGNSKEAFFYFKRALEYRKNYGKAHNNMGLAYLREGDIHKAEESFQKAIESDRESAEPYLNLAAVYRAEKRLQEAYNTLRIPIQKNLNDANLYLSYGIINDEMGRHEEAVRYYRYYLRTPATGTVKKENVAERVEYLEKRISGRTR